MKLFSLLASHKLHVMLNSLHNSNQYTVEEVHLFQACPKLCPSTAYFKCQTSSHFQTFLSTIDFLLQSFSNGLFKMYPMRKLTYRMSSHNQSFLSTIQFCLKSFANGATPIFVLTGLVLSANELTLSAHLNVLKCFCFYFFLCVAESLFFDSWTFSKQIQQAFSFVRSVHQLSPANK